MSTQEDTIVETYMNANGITGTERTRVDNEARELMRTQRRNITQDELARIAGGQYPRGPSPLSNRPIGRPGVGETVAERRAREGAPNRAETVEQRRARENAPGSVETAAERNARENAEANRNDV